MEAFTNHIALVNQNIKFTQEDTASSWPLCVMHVIIEEDRRLIFDVYMKPTQTNQYS